MKADLKQLVSFNSINEGNIVEPFGQANRDVLDKAISIMNRLGLSVNQRKVVDASKEKAQKAGIPYQTLVCSALTELAK